MQKIGIGSFINDDVIIGEDLIVRNYSIIGENISDEKTALIIGEKAKIGSYCILYSGSIIGNAIEIDDRCSIFPGVKIGDHVKLLYGKTVYANAIIGNDCIIGGDIPERMILKDRVTFMGEVAHSHYNPKNDWDTTDEPSPIIGEGSIIGVNSIILGGIKIGKDCYVSAGEILRCDLPDHSVFYKGKIYSIYKFRGLFNTRF